ncbi:Predicted dehydrogenase [Agreia bicolorata]|uniref:Predicted dehydrogenase n=1 Tax=Agreia bicolorata TaxID=110935 RepID=A0A1T4WSJ6_9MICO|nr:Gfo/Idh/MocA family oxidoreductase [Agreia bicolorata]SKA80316.1 Predicted dehydrogenase [Agreia bicolorata]
MRASAGAGSSTPTQRWAAIGTGTISRSVVPDLQACDGVDVTVVHSRDASKAARFADDFGIARSTDDYAGLLADDNIDVVYLATPFATHHRMAREALEAGKHVLVEKPITMTSADAAELFDIAAAHNVFLMEAMWMKFSPVFLRLHEEIADGCIGQPRNLRASFGIPFPSDGNSSKWDVARSGGALLDQGIYPITLAHSVFGVPVGVTASGTIREDGLDVAEHFTLEFSDGRFAQCSSSLAEFTELTASVGGETGWLTLTSPFWATTDLEVHARTPLQIFRVPELIEYPREGSGYQPMLRAVRDAIGNGLTEHPAHTAADTIAVMRTIDDIFALLRRSP